MATQGAHAPAQLWPHYIMQLPRFALLQVRKKVEYAIHAC